MIITTRYIYDITFSFIVENKNYKITHQVKTNKKLDSENLNTELEFRLGGFALSQEAEVIEVIETECKAKKIR